MPITPYDIKMLEMRWSNALDQLGQSGWPMSWRNPSQYAPPNGQGVIPNNSLASLLQSIDSRFESIVRTANELLTTPKNGYWKQVAVQQSNEIASQFKDMQQRILMLPKTGHVLLIVINAYGSWMKHASGQMTVQFGF